MCFKMVIEYLETVLCELDKCSICIRKNVQCVFGKYSTFISYKFQLVYYFLQCAFEKYLACNQINVQHGFEKCSTCI